MPDIVSGRPQFRTLHALAFVVFSFSFSAQAQNGPVPAGPTGSAPTAGHAAGLTLELSAHDKKGNPILDLAPSEVQIIEAGTPVPLTSLRLVTEPQVPPMVTLLFDEVGPAVAKTDRDMAEEFLKEASGHGLLFMVLRGEGRLHLVQAPTADIEAVRKAIAVTTVAERAEVLKVTEAAEKQMEEDAKNGSGSRQMMAKILKAMLLDSQRIVKTDGRSTPSVAALLAASRGQQILPGRKFIVFFSQGIPHYANSPEELRDIVQAANRAHVSIYAVDAEMGDPEAADAMRASSAMGMEEALGNVTIGITDPPGTGTAAAEFADRMVAGGGGGIPKSLEAICLSTGGGHVYALAGDSRSRARGIVTDLTSYYLASWTSPGSAATSRQTPIRVQSLRKGVILQSRYAARVGDRETVSAVEGKLIEALASAQLPAALPLNSAVLRFGNTQDNHVNSVMVQVPLDRLATVSNASGAPSGTVPVLAQLKDKSGSVVQKFSEDLPRQGTLDNRPGTLREIVSFRRQFSAPPGEYVLESVAMDPSDGKFGAQRGAVTIPPVASGLALGDVLLVLRIDPAGASEAADPLRCTQGTVVPNLSGHVSKAAGQKIALFFDLHADPGSADAPSLAAELRRDGALIASVPLKLGADLGHKTIPYMFSLGTASLEPGLYQAAVILSQGEHKVSQSVSFTLE